jgi:putative addiction module killer protein
VYYETGEGKQPFRDWFYSLKDKEGRNKIRVRIARLELGNLGYCRPIGEGVMEMKIDFGPGYRVYFGQMGSKIVVLLCGGDKKNQRRDIRNAHEYWSDHRRRHG